MLHKLGLEWRFVQKSVKVLDEAVKDGLFMVMTDRIAGLLPDVCLRVLIGIGWRKLEQFQTGILMGQLVNGWAKMLRARSNNRSIAWVENSRSSNG
ncbi:MAG: hypothetical protein ABI947_17420 [Chloroflexota bacterium]